MLHAGVVNGSAILLLRWHPALAASAPITVAAVGVGLASVLAGMAVARTKPDVKGGLAWTTVAQMGFMTIQCSLGLVGPAVVHMLAHGMFKSWLFLGSGSGLEGHGSHAHPAPLRPTPIIAALAVVTGGGLVALSLAVVRPEFLDHPAAIVPVAAAWSTVSMVLAQWWGRSRGEDLWGRLAPVGAIAVGLGASTAIAASLGTWLDAGPTNPHPGLASALGVFVVAVIGGAWLAGAMADRLPARVTDAAWMRVAALATPGVVLGSPAPARPAPPRPWRESVSLRRSSR